MENKLAKNIKKLRIEKGLSQEELGKQIDASKQAISGWEIGNRDPNKSQRQKLCEFFSITEGELFGQIISSNPKTIDIPLIGEVPAGKFNFAFEEVVDHITVNYDFVNRKNCFALKVKGNCLKDAGIMNGDIVIVAPDVHINNGDFVVARVDDECTMKKFYKTKGILNRYGSLAVFSFNALPLPSQLLSVILGVFRYNKTRFYVFFLSGQAVKLAGITIIYYFF